MQRRRSWQGRLRRASWLRSPRTGDRRWVIAAIVVLTAAIGGLRVVDDRASDSALLFVVPIAMCAMRFGLRGGVSSAAIGLALTLAWSLSGDNPLSLVGYVTTALAFLLVGAIVGRFADRRRELEVELGVHQISRST